MRPLPILIAVLVLALGLGIALRVLSGNALVPAAIPVVAASTADTGGVVQGHVYTGAAEEPVDLNPLTVGGGVAHRLLLSYTHDSLLDHDPVTGALRPALAEHFEMASDGLSCTFTLRPNVQFADGRAMTMEDVLFGWELAKAGHLPMGVVRDAFDRVDHVEVLDERRFRLHFRSLFYATLEAVGEAWLVTQRQFFVDRVAALKSADEPMPSVDSERFAVLLDRVDDQCGPGTGPYMFDPEHGLGQWRPHQDIQLVRNPHCWRRRVAPGTWNFAGIRVLFRDQAGHTHALLRGELDWFSSPLLDDLLASHPELAQSYRALRYDYRQLGVFRVVWNCLRPPFDDVRVRQALAMLFDTRTLIAIAGGNAMPALAHAKVDAPEYPRDVKPFPFDPAAVRRALRELGFDPEQGHPLHLVLLAPSGTEQLRRMVDLFLGAAKLAGVDLEVHSREYRAYLAERKAGEWDGWMVQQGFRSWGDPYDFVHSEGLWNAGKWANAEADRLATEARGELDAARRADLLRELHTLVYREQPAALLVHPMASILLNSHIENLAPGPFGLRPERAFVPIEFQRQ